MIPPVSDVVTGLLFVLVGVVVALRGYFAMRILLPIWGALFGFGVGAGVVAAITGDGVLSTALSWVVGFVVALAFAALAYLYYAVSIVVTMGAAGVVIGATALLALGVTWEWLVVLGALTVGVLFGVAAIALDLPMMLLVIVTAFAGAGTATGGLLLLFGSAEVADLDDPAFVDTVELDALWWGIYVALAVAGLVVQLRAIDSWNRTIREEWDATGSGGPSSTT